MTVPALRGRLLGNYAVINRTQVLATDTRVGRSASGLAASLIPADDVQILQPTPQVVVGAPVTPVATSDWILPAVAIISTLILALLIFVIISSFRKRQ
jgi:hypothetical protein